MITVTKQFTFDAAHRLLNHAGRCRHLHGHTYTAEITIQAMNGLNDLGMVIDFGDLKSTIGRWINENWDHNILLNFDDPIVSYIEKNEEKNPYLMRRNPTAEYMALELEVQVVSLLRDQIHSNQIRVSNVRIYETPTCWADSSNSET